MSGRRGPRVTAGQREDGRWHPRLGRTWASKPGLVTEGYATAVEAKKALQRILDREKEEG